MKKTLIVVLIAVFGLLAVFVSVICIPGETRADGQITFADPRMEFAVREAFGISEAEPILDEMALTLTSLNASSYGIENPNGLENFTNLIELNLGDNHIADISGLDKLTNLQWLDLGNNSISDVGPLGNLRDLQWLNLRNNPIGDITSLFKLKNLKWLGLLGTLINDAANDPNSPRLNGGGEGTLLDIWQSFSDSFGNLSDSFGNLSNRNNLPIQPYREGGNFVDNTSTLNEFWQTRMDLWNQTLGDIRSLAGDANAPWADFGSNFMNNIFSMTGNRKDGSGIWNNMLYGFNSSPTTSGRTDYYRNVPWADYYNNLPWTGYYNNSPWANYYNNLPWTGYYNNSPWTNLYSNRPWVYFYSDPPWGNFTTPWANFYSNLPWGYQPRGGNIMRHFESYIRSLGYNSFSARITFPVYQPGKILHKALRR